MIKFPAIYIDNDEGNVWIGVTGYPVKECSLVSAKAAHKKFFYDSENRLYLSNRYIIQGEYDDIGNPFVKEKYALKEIHDFDHSEVLKNILENLKNDPLAVYDDTSELSKELEKTKSAVEIIRVCESLDNDS